MNEIAYSENKVPTRIHGFPSILVHMNKMNNFVDLILITD